MENNNQYQWSVNKLTAIENTPKRPLKGKLPMSMKFIDSIGQVFLFRKGKFMYLYTVMFLD